MSKQYKQEYQNNNFVFPNNDPWEYGVEIIHNINNNSVTGSVSSFTASLSGGNVVYSFNYTWTLNGADRFINQSGGLSILSVNMMTNSKIYYKPWRTIGYLEDANVALTTKSGTFNGTVTPSQMGVASFTSGTYYFEVRFIGDKEVYPLCVQISI